jgi:glyoxylase-like metal-dependent hydrolase (beta-lactamase superfamily II)
VNEPVQVIDCLYTFEKYAAAYLLIEGERAAFVDVNTSHAVPILVEKLKSLGLGVENVDYIIVTHAHLDHSGGSAALLHLCPDAKLVAHPRAARHLIHPEKLIESAEAVYGKVEFSRLYGEIKGAPEARVITKEDGATLEWGTRKFQFLHTRGHANHHFCIFDEKYHSIFTGDSFGLCYPALQSKGLFILPSTSPTDFDEKEALLSFERLMTLRPKRLWLTHFGAVEEALHEEAYFQLKEHILASGDLERLLFSRLKEGRTPTEIDELALQESKEFLEARLSRRGFSIDEQRRFLGPSGLLHLDLELNAQGVAFVAKKRFGKTQSSDKG